MWKIHWLLSAFLITVLKLEGQVQDPLYAITGSVIDSITGRPIPRAEITVVQIDNPQKPKGGVITGLDGSFRFQGLIAGEYRLQWVHNDYYGVVDSTGLTPDVAFRLDTNTPPLRNQ